MQLVLDTHVWLDWLVFDGPQHAPLREWLSGGQEPIILATEAMLTEFERVIGRPQFALSAERIAQCVSVQRARVRRVIDAPDCRLPCSDPDDQCFIDLAVAHAADALLSRDKALLRLARHARRRFGVQVLTPEAFLLTLGAPSRPFSKTQPQSG
ncbi:MAG: putative toxin-antitoxin system toxin component, PIN family [Burkholderiales bacterium]